jgi:hypothetical protein
MDATPQLLNAIGFGIDGRNTNESLTPNPIAAAPIRKRRNGLQPACEPCRKAKVRCDTFPPGSLCSRCRKRKTPDHCIFLAAPMTRQFRSISNEPGASLPTPKSPSKSTGAKAGRSPSSAAATPISSGGRKVAGPSGFLGSTSFSATIHDHEDDAASSNDAEEAKFANDMDPSQIAMGVNVLRILPGRGDCQKLLGRYMDSPGEVGFLKPSIKNVLDSLFATYQSYLREPRRDGDLEKLSEVITRSSASIFIPPEDAIGWMQAFSGPNTRWESVGILLHALAYGLLGIPDRDYSLLEISSIYPDKKKGVLLLKEAIESCLELCKHSLNTLVCSLLYKNLLFETVLHGDSSKLFQDLNNSSSH